MDGRGILSDEQVERFRRDGFLVVRGMHSRALPGPKWAPLSDEYTDDRPCEAVHRQPGDAVFFDAFAPHRSAPNRTDKARRVLYITYNTPSEGDSRARDDADERRNCPPDIEREPGKEYRLKV